MENIVVKAVSESTVFGFCFRRNKKMYQAKLLASAKYLTSCVNCFSE